MTDQTQQKVTRDHLTRDAYLYVRQSTIRQVYEHTESTERQYALRERAIALGWPNDRIHVIDTDLGHSAAAGSDREGFQHLVAEVGMGRAGVVMGLEVSRLARTSSDWHRLLEICTLTGTLLLDEERLYDPCNLDDRLLLNEAVRRGEMEVSLHVGFIHDEQGKVVPDPDVRMEERQRLRFPQRIGDRPRKVQVDHLLGGGEE